MYNIILIFFFFLLVFTYFYNTILYLLFLFTRERKIIKLINNIKILENTYGKIFFITNTKCRCKKKFNNKILCLRCRINNIINIESLECWMNLLSNLNQTEPINLIIHTKGGLSASSDGCAKILAQRQGKINIYVPEYAFSAGTIIALSGDNIYMNWYSLMGPVDSQMDYEFNSELEISFSTKYIKNIKTKSDREYLQKCLAKAYHNEAEECLRSVLGNNENIEIIIDTLLNTKYSHEFNFSKQDLINLNLPIIKKDISCKIMDLFNLFQEINY